MSKLTLAGVPDTESENCFGVPRDRAGTTASVTAYPSDISDGIALRVGGQILHINRTLSISLAGFILRTVNAPAPSIPEPQALAKSDKPAGVHKTRKPIRRGEGR